jgi:histidine ammonia-lyase
VQDPYCIRCQPQVTGAALDLLRFAGPHAGDRGQRRHRQSAGAGEEGKIVSGGNFHAEPVAFAADQIALAMAEIGAIAQRRVALMVDPTLSFDLPPFLTPEPGLNSGLMIAEVTTAALMSENKHLANPCSTDSTPTSANQEDHVSMAAHGARRLARMNANLTVILGVELMCAAQGIEFRAPLTTSPVLQSAIGSDPRQSVPSLGEDRYMAPDIARAAAILRGPVTAMQRAPLLWSWPMTPVEIRRGEFSACAGPAAHRNPCALRLIFARLTPLGQTLGDTDWHVDRLYDGLWTT